MALATSHSARIAPTGALYRKSSTPGASLRPALTPALTAEAPGVGVAAAARPHRVSPRRAAVAARAYTVQLEHEGGVYTFEVSEGESILQVALDSGLDVPHDCKLGVCMNCAAKLVSGKVDQSATMLSDEVREKGYVLLCCAQPRSDLAVKVIEEEELLREVMV